MISKQEKLMVDMAALYSNFKLSKSKLSGEFKASEQFVLRVDSDTEPDTWKAFNAPEGNFVKWQDIKGVSKTTISEFILTYKDLKTGQAEEKKEELSKEAADSLKAGGFEIPEEAPVVNDQPPEKPQKNPREEAEARLREAEEAKEKEEAELEKANKEKAAQKTVSDDLYEEPDSPEEDLPPVTKGEVKLLDILYELIEDDLLQIFGHTGTGKTSIAMKAAFEARERKKSVVYIDTEHNITPKQASGIKKLGIVYEYIPKFDNLYTFIKKLPKYDVVIVDSLGLPVLALFADANMKEKGIALQKMIAASAFLKNYANENHSLVIVLNQPESDMNKDPNTERKPFGDKSSYCYKEIISSKFTKGGRTEDKTTIVVKAFRSRSCGMGTKLFTVEITGAGIKVVQ